MFQGSSFRIERKSKNRYEFRSPYTIQFGTFAEIQELLATHMAQSQRSSIELAVAKLKLKEMAAVDELPPPAPPVLEVKIAPRVCEIPEEVTRVRARPHRVVVVDRDVKPENIDKPKRRPNSLAYLNALRAEEAQEAAQNAP